MNLKIYENFLQYQFLKIQTLDFFSIYNVMQREKRKK